MISISTTTPSASDGNLGSSRGNEQRAWRSVAGMLESAEPNLQRLCRRARARHVSRRGGRQTVESSPVTAASNYGNGSVAPSGRRMVPTLTFTSPSEEGSYGRLRDDVLSNPWDMNAVSDFDLLTHLTNPHIESLALETPGGAALGPQSVFRATRSWTISGGAVGDPYVDPAVRQRPRLQLQDRHQPLSHSDVRIRRTQQAPRHSARIDCAHRLAGERRVRRKRQRRHHFQQPRRRQCQEVELERDAFLAVLSPPTASSPSTA